jgi:thiamine pyrophosphate-dependent acetolactate synthase large subunit-like protein
VGDYRRISNKMLVTPATSGPGFVGDYRRISNKMLVTPATSGPGFVVTSILLLIRR